MLIPPNTNVIEVHFTMGNPSGTLFEVSFSNATTDLRIYTTCSGASYAEGQAVTGGCIVELNQDEWEYMALANRGGDPVTVKVRSVGCDGAKLAASAQRQISFAQENLTGTLYYWASERVTIAGTNYNSGGIYRYDFGRRDQAAEPVLTPDSSENTSLHACIGCHSISRDGRKMVFDFDDNDSDDEYSDVYTNIFDVASRGVINPLIKKATNAFPPGYHTWNRETSRFLLTDGPGDQAAPPGALLRIGPSGVIEGYVQTGSLRATTPDWAPGDGQVVFAAPPNVFSTSPNAGYWMKKAGPRDDLGSPGRACTWRRGTRARSRLARQDSCSPRPRVPATTTIRHSRPTAR